MSFTVVLLIAAAALSASALAYWLLVTTEGTYLGPRVVSLLYDWTADNYDGIKGLQFVEESRYLGIPLSQALQGLTSPLVLDVATGTARVPLALAREPGFAGTAIGVDRSSGMLRVAQHATDGLGHVFLSLQDSGSLAFAANTFDCVTCLEALEFFSDPAGALRECVRVLKPGGVLLVSNRVGTDAAFFRNRLTGRGNVERCLRELGMDSVDMRRWQVHYDLVWAIKPVVG